ncbi:uncharacterized protein LOC129589211 [Paramacrobiotus metropolitanus]|uniref:uncharacterized protein LOC129589211 n=1 Tax=Paramacrobiotus metropolitanus TaxID=2943436 RepID=UPI0024464DDE|nr:uncharacterized protein LOC129589211 [Paramacrobiotus metropolitanus]
MIIFGGNDNVRMTTTALIFGIVTISEMFASGKRSTPDRLPLQLSASHSSFQNPPPMHSMKSLLDVPDASNGKLDNVRGRRRSAPAAVSHAGMKNFAVDAMETAAVSQENAGKQTKGCSIRLRLPVICENVVEDSVLTDKVVNRNAKDLPGFGCNSSDIAPQSKKQSCFWGRLWQFIKAALIGMCGTIGLMAAIYVVIL